MEATVTRCKFKCDFVQHNAGGSKNAPLSPVYGDSPENKSFWKYTPTGKLEINHSNPSVEFVPGAEYYIDVSLATAAPPVV